MKARRNLGRGPRLRELIGALERLWRDPALRRQLGEGAHGFIRAEHAPRRCAERYAQAIEATYRDAQVHGPGLLRALARLESAPADDAAWVRLAEAMALNMPARLAVPQLLVDVTDLDGRAQAGLGRHGTLGQLLQDAPAGWRVEPVYRNGAGAYLYARRFTLRLLACPEHALPDEVAEMRSGDRLLVPGAHSAALPALAAVLQHWRDQGVGIEFVEGA